MYGFNKCALPAKTDIWAKFFVMLGIALCTPWFSHAIHWEESKYIGVISFGYTCFRVWGEKKPVAYLATLWKYAGVFLFGTIGASVQFSRISGDVLGRAIAVILVGLFVRWFATFFATHGANLEHKERLFVAFGWMPKATV